MKFTCDPDLADKNPYVVYILKDSANVIQFIGACKYSSVVCTPDARKNTLFYKVFPPGAEMTVEIIHVSDNEKRYLATNFIHGWILENGRPFMLRFGGRIGSAKPVKCVDTGVIYPTQRDAAKALGVSQSQMSNHMMRRPGYTKCAGKTFVWAIND